MKLRKGDKVKITAGKDKDKDGVIDRVYAKSEKILIQGINMVKRHVKKNQELPQGGIIDMPRPLRIANVALVCPKCAKTTRVSFQVDKEGKKKRMCKKCQATFK